ncbi:MAG: sulfotransferase domain-containing protein [Terriglobia bacterium]
MPLEDQVIETIRRYRHRLSMTRLREPLVWYRHRGLRASDAWVASYPRSGSTWLRFLLMEVLTGQPSEFGKVDEVIPDVGRHPEAPELLPGSGRLIKTHQPYRRDCRKAVFLVRDLRDVVMSEYAYQRALGWAEGGLEEYLPSFLNGKVNPFGSWQSNTESWMNSPLAGRGDLLVVRFEDLRRNSAEKLGEIVEFCGVRPDAEKIRKAIENNSLERMREKEKRNPQKASKRGRFVRSGAVGGWREALSEGQLRLITQHAGRVMARLGYAETGTLAEAGIPSAVFSSGANSTASRLEIQTIPQNARRRPSAE